MKGTHLTFLGGNETVTGSRHLIRSPGGSVLVDCGMFQGYKSQRLRNWEAPPFEPASIDAVLLTHAHLDHSGLLPRLHAQGFRGPVYATRATAALCDLLLRDAGRLQEEDARFAGKHGFSRHAQPLPLYTEEDAAAVLRQFRSVEYGHEFVAGGVACRFSHAGHLLGAASIAVRAGGSDVLFSGDLGRDTDPVVLPPDPPPAADLVVIESTYGDRLHPAVDPAAAIEDLARHAAARGAVMIVPSFAVGRAQALCLLLSRAMDAGRIPHMPLYLDSPMAIGATQAYERHPELHRLTRADLDAMHRRVTPLRTAAESKHVGTRSGPMIVVAASGMATGGRVLHHLKQRAPEPRNLIVLSGYQAGGTRGAALARGERLLRIHGEDVTVRAEVAQVDSLSAHADADGLMAWLRRAPRVPNHVHVVHGEPEAADALRKRIERELGCGASVARFGDSVRL
jgi:metallo-beta-lactamase family protein